MISLYREVMASLRSFAWSPEDRPTRRPDTVLVSDQRLAGVGVDALCAEGVAERHPAWPDMVKLTPRGARIMGHIGPATVPVEPITEVCHESGHKTALHMAGAVVGFCRTTDADGFQIALWPTPEALSFDDVHAAVSRGEQPIAPDLHPWNAPFRFPLAL